MEIDRSSKIVQNYECARSGEETTEEGRVMIGEEAGGSTKTIQYNIWRGELGSNKSEMMRGKGRRVAFVG